MAYANGGEAGARLAAQLGLPTSPDTLLRSIPRDLAGPDAPLRVVGVDDWAMRKGQRYGTLVVDLERRQVVEVLDSRDAAAVAG